MRKIVLLAILTVTVLTANAQRETLWSGTNVELEEITRESGEVIYNIYSKEMKYEEMFYLLTVSTGDIQEVYSDVKHFDEFCNLPKGSSESFKGKDIASRDSKSVFIVVEGEVGFTAMFHHDLKKLIKILEKRAEENGITLKTEGAALSSAEAASQSK